MGAGCPVSIQAAHGFEEGERTREGAGRSGGDQEIGWVRDAGGAAVRGHGADYAGGRGTWWSG